MKGQPELPLWLKYQHLVAEYSEGEVNGKPFIAFVEISMVDRLTSEAKCKLN